MMSAWKTALSSTLMVVLTFTEAAATLAPATAAETAHTQATESSYRELNGTEAAGHLDTLKNTGE